MPELKPCPWCGHKPIVKSTSDGAYFAVECGPCGMRGPEFPTEKSAVAAWNELPREQETPE